MKRFITSLFILTLLAISVAAGSWHADTLGQGFMMRQFDQGRDYSGPVVSTLVRLEPDSATDRAVLYIHGFNDYFFQTEMARKFVDHGYTFYAVDLRKYGRSLLPGQKRCQVRSFDEYTADLDSAFAVIGAEGHSHIVLMGHSTGGLVASYYLERHPRPEVCAVILNSPFLDWNLGKMECLLGGVAFLGRIFPNIAFSSGSSTAYGESLDADYHGRWHFNHQWKALGGTKVDLGWVKAISQAQRYLRRHKYAISQPILLMYSARSVSADKWNPEVNRADAVLDVRDIRKYGLMLGHDVTAIAVEGGIHDLVLSADSVRYPLYDYIFRWLGQIRY